MANVPRVLVTGASGFIATHVVQQLQQTGQYLVRGTVRSLKNPKKVDPLRRLCDNPKYELELVEADLTKEEGWVDAVKGCTYVLHMASPFPADDPADENEVIKPAVEGTLKVLKAAREVGGVKRVVLTSSVAAVSGGFSGGTRPYTEADWTDTSVKGMLAYIKSKALAEKAAWEYLKGLPDGEKFELAVINPVLVIGPALCGTVTASMELVQRFMENKMPGIPKINFALIDVRDVATAHLRAMELPEAAGQRHIVSTETMWMAEISKILDDEFKPLGYKIPTCTVPKAIVVIGSWFDKTLKSLVPSIDKVTEYDNTRMLSVLGIKPIAAKKSLIDMGYSMIEGGHVKKTDKYSATHPSGK